MKTKTTLMVEETLWRRFRGACIERGLTASGLFEAFMREQLQKWGAVTAEERQQKYKTKQ